MISSGIDWSGDPGNPRISPSPLLVIALAHIDGRDLADLTLALGGFRSALGLKPNFPFKFAHCSDKVRLAFFSGIAAIDVGVHLSIIDKSAWYPAPRATRPNDRLTTAIADLVCAVPPDLIGGQVLLIDLPRRETTAVQRIAGAVKQGLKAAGTRPYPEIKPCPDTRSMGEIVQVADMFAGAVHDDGPTAHWLARTRHRYRIV